MGRFSDTAECAPKPRHGSLPDSTLICVAPETTYSLTPTDQVTAATCVTPHGLEGVDGLKELIFT